MTAPTFFIVGAQKAGTTSLHAMLSQHDEVFMSDPKEPGYFIRGFDDEERWQTLLRPDEQGGIEPLSQVEQGIYSARAYRDLFTSDEARCAKERGESSTPYLPSPNAARRIKESVPDAKIVIMLREPISRAYSAWGYNSSRGRECVKTFEEAVAQELAGERDQFIYGSRYLYSGLYARHVGRFLELFGRENVLVLNFDDFKADSQAVFDRVCDFLGLPRQQIKSGSRENVTVHHANPVLRALRNAFNLPGTVKALVKPLMPRAMRNKVRRRVTTFIDEFGTRPEPLAPTVRDQLARFYADDLAKLATMVDFDISHWGSPAKHSGNEKNG